MARSKPNKQSKNGGSSHLGFEATLRAETAAVPHFTTQNLVVHCLEGDLNHVGKINSHGYDLDDATGRSDFRMIPKRYLRTQNVCQTRDLLLPRLLSGQVSRAENHTYLCSQNNSRTSPKRFGRATRPVSRH